MTRLIQISDIHLLADADQCLGNVNTQASLETIMQSVNKQRPDLLVMSGDLSQDGSLISYQRLAQTLSSVNCPVYWIAGNHDDKENAQIGLKGENLFADGAVFINGWQLIFLDSTAPGLDDGFLATEDFAHLQNCLERHPRDPALIVMHHHPVDVGCYMDAVGLINADKFLEFLQTFPQVRVVLFGHVHQEFATIKNNVAFLGAPSTGVQFAPKLEKFTIDTQVGPGYRWVELSQAGGFRTGVIRIP